MLLYLNRRNVPTKEQSMKVYFYQLNSRTWKVMDSKFLDVGRIREMADGRTYCRMPGSAGFSRASLSDVQQDLLK